MRRWERGKKAGSNLWGERGKEVERKRGTEARGREETEIQSAVEKVKTV